MVKCNKYNRECAHMLKLDKFSHFSWQAEWNLLVSETENVLNAPYLHSVGES